MIERWFPCQEVSENSAGGWGSGNSEANLFTWFAKRPLAQARAAVLCSLLPWPEDAKERLRLQRLVREAMSDYNARHDELRAELRMIYPDGASMLDPFSGRAMIPLEAARLGIRAWGIDYSPSATLAGRLLADYPMREWASEPELPWRSDDGELTAFDARPRLLRDVEAVVKEVGDRFRAAMSPFYPTVDGSWPWGYLWAVSLPCQECGNYFPLTGSLVLRNPNKKANDPGQSYRIEPDRTAGTYEVVVHDGPPTGVPTRVVAQGKSRYDASGKVAVCPFCGHTHPKDVHTRLAANGLGRDVILVAADLDSSVGKRFRNPVDAEIEGASSAEVQLTKEPPFLSGLSPVPSEPIPEGNTWTIQASVYGATTYGDMCNARQTLAYVRLARAIEEVGQELLSAGVSQDYATALCSYPTAVMVRKLRRSTRGCTLQPARSGVSDVFATESSLAFSYDYFEAGLADGPGSWESVKTNTLAALRKQFERAHGVPALIQRGNAIALPVSRASLDCVVTDPPYDAMIDYSDASDLGYVWLKRALGALDPEIAITDDPRGLQDKEFEIIVKKGGTKNRDHRTQAHYDKLISQAFRESAAATKPDGVVTIVFGHGDPDVWHRLLSAISEADLVLTGSWPARTEKGGKVGFSNIETTLTLACRPASPGRQPGRVAEVDAEVRAEIRSRIPLWDGAGLALTDQLMASAGPAMEVVGRYSEVRDKSGQPVELDRYLPLARRFVEEAADIKVDTLPLETFDQRTRFALFWVRLNERSISAASEARWQRLASDLSDDETAGLLTKDGKGLRFSYSSEVETSVRETSSVIDAAMAVAAAGRSVAGVAGVLVEAGRTEDPFVWAAMGELSRLLPEADRDGETWTWVVRNRNTIVGASRNVEAAQAREEQAREEAARQTSLFGGDD
jgi:adenine-specific DNA methylase